MWQPKLPPISVPARAAAAVRRGRPRPLYLRIVDALAADVASGRVAADTRLPTQRELAERLGTTIATVTRAYSEARRRGLVSATVGRGTFVHAAPAHATSGIADLTLNQLLATPFGGELIAAASTIDPDLLTSLLEYQPHTRPRAPSARDGALGRPARRAGLGRRDRRHRRRAAQPAGGAGHADAARRHRAHRSRHLHRR